MERRSMKDMVFYRKVGCGMAAATTCFAGVLAGWPGFLGILACGMLCLVYRETRWISIDDPALIVCNGVLVGKVPGACLILKRSLPSKKRIECIPAPESVKVTLIITLATDQRKVFRCRTTVEVACADDPIGMGRYWRSIGEQKGTPEKIVGRALRRFSLNARNIFREGYTDQHHLESGEWTNKILVPRLDTYLDGELTEVGLVIKSIRPSQRMDTRFIDVIPEV